MNALIRAHIERYMPVIDGVADLPFIPEILRERGGEFCGCHRIDRTMVAAVCRSGYIPMGLEVPGVPGVHLLLVKSHAQRCILDPSDIHVGQNVKRYARGLRMRCNGDFSEVISAVVDAYPDRWLVPPLVKALEEVHTTPTDGVRVHSVEVRDGTALVAGEIGYSVGDIYTSLSGFHRRNGSGTVQMVALAALLQESGIRLWDLGMEADYKMKLGASRLDRDQFLRLYRRQSADPENVTGPTLPEGWRECPELIRMY